ncbi:hypothetical protein [Corynebacterium glutamicum]|uniref:hypothetical protein n=1 Tax=Corynebacterium glutamicum TaxID=1718 RepID=UPI00146837E7|nr:hypothetical protein [Corynebacterium glutamicum]GFK17959.1 hypothetical protein KbCgl_05310 [Corynebacterium glutamicum]
MRTSLLTLAIAATLTLAGCSSLEETKYPLSGLQEYEVSDQIAEELNAGGFDCTDYERGTGSLTAASSGTCWHPHADTEKDQEIIVMVFNTESDQNSQAQLYRNMADLIDSGGFVTGGNWMVNCGNKPVCTSVAEVLGGRTETASVF